MEWWSIGIMRDIRLKPRDCIPWGGLGLRRCRGAVLGSWLLVRVPEIQAYAARRTAERKTSRDAQ